MTKNLLNLTRMGAGRNPGPLQAGFLDPGLRRGDESGVCHSELVGPTALLPAEDSSPYLCHEALRREEIKNQPSPFSVPSPPRDPLPAVNCYS